MQLYAGILRGTSGGAGGGVELGADEQAASDAVVSSGDQARLERFDWQIHFS